MKNDLPVRLDEALRGIGSSAAPVQAAMRAGRALRWRRRAVAALTAAACVAAASAAVTAFPRHIAAVQPGSSPAATPRITVSTPGHGPAGTIGSGTIDGKHWRLFTGSSGGQQCVRGQGGALGPADGGIVSCGTLFGTPDGEPVSFQSTGVDQFEAIWGQLRADVAYVEIRLSGGGVLTLRPGLVEGVRAVVLAIPVTMAVDSATAHSASGSVIATTVPYSSGLGTAFIGTWLRPGQRGLSRATGTVATGEGWSVTAHVGPWGLSLQAAPLANGQTTGAAAPEAALTGTHVLTLMHAGSHTVESGFAAADVSYLMFAGRQVPVVPVGSLKLFAFAVTPAQLSGHWTGYDATGHVVASGVLSRWLCHRIRPSQRDSRDSWRFVRLGRGVVCHPWRVIRIAIVSQAAARAGHRRQQGAEPQRRQLDLHGPHRRPVRHRHGLHPVSDVPLP